MKILVNPRIFYENRKKILRFSKISPVEQPGRKQNKTREPWQKLRENRKHTETHDG